MVVQLQLSSQVAVRFCEEKPSAPIPHLTDVQGLRKARSPGIGGRTEVRAFLIASALYWL